MTADLSPEMRFEDLLGEFSDIDGVTLPHGGSGFGRSALRYRGKIFAMFVRRALVVRPETGRPESRYDGQAGSTLTSATASGSRRIAVMRRSASLAGCPVRSRSTQIERTPIRAAGRMSCTQLFAM
jgi:hypothetical protein